MKTDKFDDAIRRKLESIEPPFRDRDWSHMQAFMHRHGYPSAWAGASQWLVPLAAAATVTGLIVSAVWQFHTNQQLNQSVQALNQTVARLETTQAQLLKRNNQTDTVYVTNFTKTPVPATATQLRDNQPVQVQSSAIQPGNLYTLQPATPVASDRRSSEARAVQSDLPDSRPAPTWAPTRNRLAQRTNAEQPGNAADRLSDNQPSRRPTVAQQSMAGIRERPIESISRSGLPTERSAKNEENAERTANPVEHPSTSEPSGLATATTPTVATSPENNPLSRVGQLATGTERLAGPTTSGRRTGSRRGQGAINQPTQPPTNANSGLSGNDETGRNSGSGSAPTGNQAAERGMSTIALLTGRPIALDSAFYIESLARRTRRIRSLLPALATVQAATPGPATAPTEVSSSRPTFSGIHVRLGLSGELGTVQRSRGAYGELLIGKHWSVGVGLNRVNLQGGQFDTDEQFDRITHDDFRKLYAQGIDARHPIVNIDRKFDLWQIPISLSYRGGVGKGFSLVPAVGMDFSLSAREITTFTYQRGPYEVTNVPGLPPARPCVLFNSYTAAFSAEKSWKHLVVQAGPVLSTPTKSTPDPINPVSLSFRARVLFQF